MDDLEYVDGDLILDKILECDNPNEFFAFGIIYGKGVLEKRIEDVYWKKLRRKLVQIASTFPVDWFRKNNYVHEMAIWFDGTSVWRHNEIKVGTFLSECKDNKKIINFGFFFFLFLRCFIRPIFGNFTLCSSSIRLLSSFGDVPEKCIEN